MKKPKSFNADCAALVTLLDHGIWCDSSSAFRGLFNDLVMQALVKAESCGDFTQLTKLVNAIPVSAERSRIIGILTDTYPQLTYNDQSRCFTKNRKYSEPAQEVRLPAPSTLFRAGNYSITKNETLLHRGSYTQIEAIELVFDILTEYRNQFSHDDVNAMEELLSRIKSRTSAVDRTAP